MAEQRRHTREDSGLALDREVRWWHDGEPVQHPRIVEAFNRGVRVRDDGRYVLELGADWCFIQVADAAFTVLAVDESQGERLSVRLSDRTAEWLDPASLALGEDGVLTAKVKGGRAKARFSRDAQFQLGEHLAPKGEALVLRVGAAEYRTNLPSSAPC